MFIKLYTPLGNCLNWDIPKFLRFPQKSTYRNALRQCIKECTPLLPVHCQQSSYIVQPKRTFEMNSNTNTETVWIVREKHRHVTRLLQIGNVKFHECTIGSHCIESTWYKAQRQPRNYIRRNIQRIHFSPRAIS